MLIKIGENGKKGDDAGEESEWDGDTLDCTPLSHAPCLRWGRGVGRPGRSTGDGPKVRENEVGGVWV